MKKLSLFLCLVMFLSFFTPFALAEDLPELLTMDENSFLAWFRQFNSAADYDWVPWQYDISLLNDIQLSGYLSDDGEIGSYLGWSDDADEEAVHTLTEILYVFPGTEEAFPGAEEQLSSGETCDLYGDSMLLTLEDGNSFNLGSFTLDPVTLSAGNPTLPEFEALLENAGFPIDYVNLYKLYELSAGDRSVSLVVGADSRIDYLSCTYRGEDSQTGKAFFSAAAELLDEEAKAAATALIEDNYDVLEVKENKKETVSDYSLSLSKSSRYTRFRITVNNAAEIGAAVFPVDAPAPEEALPPAAPADDGFSHTQETVLVDEAGIRFVALASRVTDASWGAPYIQFIMENNTDQLLHIELKGKFNGYNVNSIALQPAHNNMPLTKIMPGETLSGNMLFRTAFYEYMGLDNVEELVVEPTFRLDQLDARQENYELYYQGEPVSIPADGTYTPHADLPAVFEHDQLRVSAVDLLPDEIISYESGYTSPRIVILYTNPSEREYSLHFTEVKINGHPVEDGQLEFLNGYRFEANSNAFATLYLKPQAKEALVGEDLKTITGTVSGLSWTLGEGYRRENLEEFAPAPFSIGFN